MIERTFVLSGGREMAAQVWEKPGKPLLLALHGWLDNSASFFELAPRLDATVIALDLAGHGHSYHRSAMSAYNIWDDLVDVQEIIAQLGVTSVGLVGHSRGAIIANLLAVALPEKISQLLLVDGLIPEPVESGQAPAQLRKALLELGRHAQRQFPIYASVSEAAKVRLQGTFPLGQAAAMAIAERGTHDVEGGVTWRVDPKLLAPSFIKLDTAQIDAFLAALKTPTTLVLGEEGIANIFPHVNYGAVISKYITQHSLAGSHHLHMETQAQAVADIFNRQLQIESAN